MANDSTQIQQVIDGYTFEGGAVDLGVLVSDDAPAPEARVRVPLGMLNRHGLIAGATGTGKTKTLQVLAEQISGAGVPVFAADIKGDLSGLAAPGESNDKLTARTDALGQEWTAAASPVEFYRLGEEGVGVPVRATISSFGPTLLAKVLELNDTQESTLGLIFYFADKNGLPLLDVKDLQAVLEHLTSDEGKDDLKGIGGVSKATVGVIQRNLTTLAAQGAESFFGEPEFDTADLLRTAEDGRGIISLMELPSVASRPEVFSTFLMWLLAELFEDLPEVGDVDKPKLVFFFDEAHLLFKDASKAFLEAITQTVRLIRSKGVGVFFVTQTPKDVPDEVLGQLGSRVQHQLRAHTPNDQKALKATVATFPKSEYDLQEVITTLGIGEAIVTVMDPEGAPTPVAWTRMFAPQTLMAPFPAEDMQAAVDGSSLQQKYGEPIDRESAHEILAKKLEDGAADAEAAQNADEAGRGEQHDRDAGRRDDERESEPRDRKKDDPGFIEKLSKNTFVRQAGRTAVREVMRGLFGTGRRRRR